MAEEVCYPRVKNTGLRGVPVADTKVSYIDGVRGELQYRGYQIQDLARYTTYEEVAFLLIHGQLPSRAELEAFDGRLRSMRPVPPPVLQATALRPRTASPMDVLQGAVPFLADHDSTLGGNSKEAVRAQSERLIAQLPTVVAAWKRIRSGERALDPRPDLPTRRTSCSCSREEPGRAGRPHPGRVPGSPCRPHVQRVHLRRPRGGKHPGPPLRIGGRSGRSPLRGSPRRRQHRGHEDAPGDRQTGKGRVVRQSQARRGREDHGDGPRGLQDPRSRAPILKEFALELGEKTGESFWIDIAEKVREVTQAELKARRGQEIYPNVDFYSAATYYQLGIEPDLFTPVFAIGRIAGWCAHVIEEKFAEAQEKPALYRPEAEYIGDYCGPQGCAFVPLGARASA